MSWMAVHLQPRLSLATDALLLPPHEAAAFADAVALAESLAALHAAESERIAAAEHAGHAAGFAAGRAEALAQVQEQAAAQLAGQAEALAHRHDETMAALEQRVVALALLVLRRVAASLPADEVVAALARQVLAQADESGRGEGHVLRLHPSLQAPVQARLDAEGAALRCRADDRLAPLDCELDTPGGRLLAGLETQLQRVQAALQQVVAR